MSTDYTVRNLSPDDVLESPYWNIPGQRPDPNYTLVAVDKDNKICGLCWMAYGGPAALFIIQIMCKSAATIQLYNAIFDLARSLGCHMVLCYVRAGSRILNVLTKRGWIFSSWGAVLIGKPVSL